MNLFILCEPAFNLLPRSVAAGTRATVTRGFPFNSASGGSRETTKGRSVLTKTLLLMKLTIFFLAFFIIKVQGGTFSQNVSFSGRDVPIKRIISAIESQTDYVIFYDRGLLNNNRLPFVNLKDVPVTALLNEALREQPIEYSIKNKTIFLYRKFSRQDGNGPGSASDTTKRQTVSGKVTATGGEPLTGVTVIEKGTSNGTSTDANGNYSLSVGNANGALSLSIVGYAAQDVRINTRTVVNVTMELSAEALSDIVVVGYGTQKKSDLTGSISSLKTSDIDKGVNVSVDQMMQGRAPGVQIVQASAEPGGGFNIRIRGSNSITAGNNPLYVIDGLPITNDVAPNSTVESNTNPRNPLNALNPGDIESIDILKDASATAIYGSRGANGVIIITTKKGKNGAMKVNYNASVGIQNIAKKLDMMNGEQYMNFLNGINEDQNLPALFTDQEISAVGKGTDWQDEIYRSAPVNNHQISFSGGSQNTQYYVSLNYLNQQGIVTSSGVRRYGARINLNHSVNRFSFGMNLNTSLVYDDYVPFGLNINAVAGTITAALQMAPNEPVYDNLGRYSISSAVDLSNPLGIAKTISDDAETNRTFGTFFAQYKLTDNIALKLNFGSDRQTARRDGYVSKATRRGQLVNGAASAQSKNNSNYLTELTLTYDKKFGGIHDIKALAGYTYQKFDERAVFASSENFPTDAYGPNSIRAGSPDKYIPDTYRLQSQLLSYLARVNYTINDKYLITASFRADGSSRFGADHKYGYFPSFAFAWKVIDEPFLSRANALSDLKFRASYGVTGNQDIGNYQSQVLLGTTASAIFDGNRYVGIAPSQLGNPDLRWESTTQFNVGVDYGFLGNRITGSLDYFVKNTSDLLLNLPIPYTTGFATSLQNVGSTRNSGIEFQIESKNLVGAFQWTTTFNIANVINKVTDLGELEQILQGSLRFIEQFSIIKEGYPINSYFGYQVAGIFQTAEEAAQSAQPLAKPGQLRFVDINNDKVINANDRTILGDAIPDFYFGLNNDFSYKGFDLSVFFEGVYGQELMNFNRVDAEFPIEFRRNRLTYVLDRWRPDNMDSPNPSLIGYVNPVNSRILEDASYLRLRNIRLGYTFPRLRSKVISSFSVFGTAQNLFTITNYSGYNPDVNVYGGSNLRIDYNAYPLSRIYTFGINLGL